ncbi:MAG: hypothetical protein APF84_16730 [Gracilibacter sp. BRH_c7a]|nr:MAG: hypothetical protein APF84_16730 [Gracilibacter sp. BRH_c7a]
MIWSAKSVATNSLFFVVSVPRINRSAQNVQATILANDLRQLILVAAKVVIQFLLNLVLALAELDVNLRNRVFLLKIKSSIFKFLQTKI